MPKRKRQPPSYPRTSGYNPHNQGSKLNKLIACNCDMITALIKFTLMTEKIFSNGPMKKSIYTTPNLSDDFNNLLFTLLNPKCLTQGNRSKNWPEIQEVLFKKLETLKFKSPGHFKQYLQSEEFKNILISAFQDIMQKTRKVKGNLIKSITSNDRVDAQNKLAVRLFSCLVELGITKENLNDFSIQLSHSMQPKLYRSKILTKYEPTQFQYGSYPHTKHKSNLSIPTPWDEGNEKCSHEHCLSHEPINSSSEDLNLNDLPQDLSDIDIHALNNHLFGSVIAALLDTTADFTGGIPIDLEDKASLLLWLDLLSKYSSAHIGHFNQSAAQAACNFKLSSSDHSTSSNGFGKHSII